MSLRDYRKKRNFRKTAEPSGQGGNHDGALLHFVVQKHAASHLHYDFRLENHGVLRSWAVPKGVPDDPLVKRLAIEVEDHPIDYQYFEGTIPKGNYGAGTVEIWDKGGYYADKDLDKKANEEKIAADLKKGHLKFFLDGEKLQGAYSLIKLHNNKGKKNEWLLIKKAPSSGEPDPIENLSGPMPNSVKPMLATLVDGPFDRKGWVFEVKWDGYRILAEVKKGIVRLYTRNGNDYTKHFAAVVQELKGLPDMVLDGEMVVVDRQGVSRFQLLQNYMRHQEGDLIYYVFDIVYVNKHDLHKVPLSQRKEILQHLITGFKAVRLSDSIEEKGKAFYKAAKDHGLEGVIAKNLSSTYQFGVRGRDWLKIKAIQEQEAVICGYTAPRGGRKFFGALILGLYEKDRLKYVGHTGGGFDHGLLKDVFDRLKPLVTDKCPFKVKPKTNAPVTWVVPQLLCEVKFQEWTDDGHMRQPIFLGLREDKAPKEIHQELPKTLDVSKTKVALSHLDKVYWPEDGYTKGDMIKYYKDIAPYILPYIKGRPQALHRQPNGIIDKGFFQKDINFKPPAWLKIFNLDAESKGETVHHLVADDPDSLIYMANLGCIEINSWCSSVQAPMHPDFLVLDFDPVDVDFNKVVDAVLEARKLLVHIKCDGFCKTSGSRGLHVYVPLKRKYNYDQVKDFSHMICMAIQHHMPEITSLERSPAKRRGLIYLDYLQNHFTATMATAYSLRPLTHAPISTPLEWKEVKRGLTSQDFNIKNIFPRLKKKGDLWKGVLGPGIDMQKSLKSLEVILKIN